MNVTKMLLGATFLTACAVATASAVPLTIGTPNYAPGNYFPFGAPASLGWGGEYQETYAKADFSGVTPINTIAFYANNLTTPGGTPDLGTFTLTLSTTAFAINGPSNNAWSGNEGANKTVVFNAALPSLSANGMLLFNLTTPFTYDPTGGNLMLDIASSNSSNTNNLALEFDIRDPGNVLSAQDNGGFIAPSSGLVTTFNPATSPVPEPMSMALLGAGLFGLGAAKHRWLQIR
jgi:PEP-CTERM motif